MAINFPDSPTNGDSFVTGGITYTWDGSSWSAAGAGGVASASLTLQDITTNGSETTDTILAGGFNSRTGYLGSYYTNVELDSYGIYLGINGSSAVPAEVRFGGQTVNDWVGFKGSLSYTGQTIWTLPGTDGSNGQVLTTDGNKVLSWTTPAGGGGGATVAGSDTQVQYNDNGSLGASAALTFSDLGGLPATRRLQVGDDPGNPSQNFVGEILTDNLNAQGSISALAGGYFGGSIQIEGLQAGTYLALTDGGHPVAIADNSFSTGTAGQVLTATGDDGSGNATGVAWSTSSGLAGRQTASATTASIGNNASANLTIAAAKTYALLKIQTSAAAWVTLYTDTASRTADAGRTENTDALPGSGVIAEVITNGAATQLMTPGVFGFNNDATPSTNVYVKVVNKSGSNAAITVTLTYTQLEV